MSGPNDWQVFLTSSCVAVRLSWAARRSAVSLRIVSSLLDTYHTDRFYSTGALQDTVLPKYVVLCTSSCSALCCSVSCLYSFSWCWMSQFSSDILEARRFLCCSASCSSHCSLEIVDSCSASCLCIGIEMQVILLSVRLHHTGQWMCLCADHGGWRGCSR